MQYGNSVIVITTHSSTIVKALDFKNLRLITNNSNNKKSIENVTLERLPYSSLNEANYLAFTEVTEEYHNELYGFIEEINLLAEFKKSIRLTRNYCKRLRDGTTKTEQISLTEYIRHQIHHPENKLNNGYLYEELEESINLMRAFISHNKDNTKQL